MAAETVRVSEGRCRLRALAEIHSVNKWQDAFPTYLKSKKGPIRWEICTQLQWIPVPTGASGPTVQVDDELWCLHLDTVSNVTFNGMKICIDVDFGALSSPSDERLKTQRTPCVCAASWPLCSEHTSLQPFPSSAEYTINYCRIARN